MKVFHAPVNLIPMYHNAKISVQSTANKNHKIVFHFPAFTPYGETPSGLAKLSAIMEGGSRAVIKSHKFLHACMCGHWTGVPNVNNILPWTMSESPVIYI